MWSTICSHGSSSREFTNKSLCVHKIQALQNVQTAFLSLKKYTENPQTSGFIKEEICHISCPGELRSSVKLKKKQFMKCLLKYCMDCAQDKNLIKIFPLFLFFHIGHGTKPCVPFEPFKQVSSWFPHWCQFIGQRSIPSFSQSFPYLHFKRYPLFLPTISLLQVFMQASVTPWFHNGWYPINHCLLCLFSFLSLSFSHTALNQPQCVLPNTGVKRKW